MGHIEEEVNRFRTHRRAFKLVFVPEGSSTRVFCSFTLSFLSFSIYYCILCNIYLPLY